MHKTISDYGITSKIIMAVLLYLIVMMVMWSMQTDREGMEIAAILAGSLTPITALFKFVMEWSDRKKSSE